MEALNIPQLAFYHKLCRGMINSDTQQKSGTKPYIWCVLHLSFSRAFVSKSSGARLVESESTVGKTWLMYSQHLRLKSSGFCDASHFIAASIQSILTIVNTTGAPCTQPLTCFFECHHCFCDIGHRRFQVEEKDVVDVRQTFNKFPRIYATYFIVVSNQTTVESASFLPPISP